MALDNVGWSVVSALSNLLVAAVALRFSPQAGALAAASLTAIGSAWWIIATRRLTTHAPDQIADTVAG
jgi:hypothetical protein